MSNDLNNPSERKAYVITGPTSGIGRRTALEVARYGIVVLVGRDPAKLAKVQKTIEQQGRRAVSVVCDLSEHGSGRRAAAEIVALDLSIAGLLNNAGIMQMRPTKNALGWDMSFVTNHLGPFELTEALMPSLPNGANVVFVVSAVEDPGRRPAVAAGFRGGRYISAEASARGEWKPDGATKPGFDAYATSKQAILAAAMAFARDAPRLRFNAIEPGLNPTTGLGGGDVGAFVRFLQTSVIPILAPLLMPFIGILSTPKRAARVITKS
jgi:NAD(P)-dependent dehydrogenase (short-subunit alcohol dehydrogenase family)